MYKVSVLLSTYNGEKYLRELIDSVLVQNTQGDQINIKLFVRDDGSKDGTIEILKEYAEKGRIILAQYGVPNIGFVESFSWLLKNAPESDYYAFCDQDDVWLPNKICNAVNRLSKEDKRIPLLYTTNLIVTDERLNEITRNTHSHMSHNSPTQFEENILVNNTLGCTVVINKVLKDLYISIPTSQIVYHDYILAILATGLGKYIYEEQPEILYRQHGKNVVGFGRGKLKDLVKSIRFMIKVDMKNTKWQNIKTLKEQFYSKFNPQQQKFIDALYSYRTDKNKKKEAIKFIKTNIKNKFIKNYSIFLLRYNKF